MKRVKITEEEFVWHVLTEAEAIHAFEVYEQEVFLLYDDDTEAKASSVKEIQRHIRHGGYVGIEVGFIDDKLN